MLYAFDGKRPVFGEGTYISETAIVVGDVKIGKDCYIGHGAILRGDYGGIEIGDGTAIEEGVIVHAPPDDNCCIGNGIIIGHGAIIHAKRINDLAAIGMGAVLSIYSEVAGGSVVAEGSVVKQKQQVPEGIIAAGSPAKKVRDITQKDLDFWDWSRKVYVELAHKYCRLGMERIG
jgi:carbonic anhydrase/acetyltransferase-like protein (isoleucine patch superfamily)